MVLVNIFYNMAIICLGVCILSMLWGWHCIGVQRRKSAKRSFMTAFDAGLAMLGFGGLAVVGLLFL